VVCERDGHGAVAARACGVEQCAVSDLVLVLVPLFLVVCDTCMRCMLTRRAIGQLGVVECLRGRVVCVRSGRVRPVPLRVGSVSAGCCGCDRGDVRKIYRRNVPLTDGGDCTPRVRVGVPTAT
jgi:hypothetical protein